MRLHQHLRGLAAGLLLVLSACAPSGSAPAAPAGAASNPGTAGAAQPAGAAPAAAAEAAPVARQPWRVAFTALVASQSVAWIAKEAGYFDRHGLDATINFINGGPAGMAALVAGDVDMLIVGASSVVRSALSGADTVLIAGTKNRMAGALMVKPDIRTAADLRGRRVGVASRASNSELVARVGLERLGLDPDADVTYLAVGSGAQRVSALQQGSIDACGCIPPDNVVAEDAGFYTIVDVTALGIKYTATGVAARRARLAESPDLFTRAMEAMAEGVHTYRTDPDFAMRVIQDYTKHDDLRSLRVGYDVERELMAPDLRVDPEAVQATLVEIAATEPRAAQAQVDDFIEPRFVNALASSGFLDRLNAPR